MILVTGATGIVGSHLVGHLLSSDARVRALYRDKSKIEIAEKVILSICQDRSYLSQLEWVACDINDVVQLEEVFDAVVQVYHCAGYVSFDEKQEAQLIKINTEGTANVVNQSLSTDTVKHLCYISSIATIGKPKIGQLADEETEFSLLNTYAYAESKYLGELEVFRGIQEGLSAFVVNPGVILDTGLWMQSSGKLYKTLRRNKKFYAPGGTGFVSVNDVAKVAMVLMSQSVHNEKYILVAENRSFRSIHDQVAVAFSNRKPAKALTKLMLTTMWVLDWLSGEVFENKRNIYKTDVSSLLSFTKYSNAKISKQLPDYQWESIDEVIADACKVMK